MTAASDKVMERTNCPRLAARTLLNKHGGDVDMACDEYFKANPWDFTLPQLPPAGPQFLLRGVPSATQRELTFGPGWEEDDWTEPTGFNLQNLISAIQRGGTCQDVREYLTHHSEMLGSKELKLELTQRIDGFPPIFFVVETGNAEMVQLWTRHTNYVDCAYRGVPLLGYAIALCQSFRKNTPMVVRTLLSMGASVKSIPRSFYSPLQEDIPDDGPLLQDPADPHTSWYGSAPKQLFARALNFSFTVRYLLQVASQHLPLSGANKQVASLHKASDLFGIRYFLVGQTLAVERLTKRLLVHLAMLASAHRPLVLLFAGPSGHGKTELARKLGRMLSLKLHSVDCTNLSHETDLFGPWAPYVGSEEGSAVNNHLANNNGQRCIVFMDEFEKTKEEVRQALLLPFGNGEYRDRRFNTPIDCRKTIWILATNAFDTMIQGFYERNQEVFDGDRTTKKSEELVRELGVKLSREIQNESINVLGAPLTGRIMDFIPFIPFSPTEQAAVADKYLAEQGQDLVQPIDGTKDSDRSRLVGNIDLRVKHCYSVCKQVAEQGYIRQLGARSIINAIDREIMMPLVGGYLDARDEIRETQSAASFVVGVDVDSRMVKVSECTTD